MRASVWPFHGSMAMQFNEIASNGTSVNVFDNTESVISPWTF
jgi:hypothetical protein